MYLCASTNTCLFVCMYINVNVCEHGCMWCRCMWVCVCSVMWVNVSDWVCASTSIFLCMCRASTNGMATAAMAVPFFATCKLTLKMGALRTAKV